jgi:unsaturated rhamnogalacturonyl hydrolase
MAASDEPAGLAPAALRRRVNRWKIAFFGLLGGLALLAFYEKYPSFEHRYWPPERPWKTLTTEYLDAVRGEALADLRSDESAGRQRPNISRTRRALSDLLDGNEPAATWSHAQLSLALLASADARGSKEDQQAVESYVRSIADENGQFHKPIEKLEQCMVGAVFLELYARTGEVRYRRAADTLAEFLLHKHPRSKTGTLPYRPAFSRESMLTDALGMICPFLVRYGVDCDSPEALALGLAQLDEFLAYAIDPASGLPYHAYNIETTEGQGLIGWVRGTGWLFLGFSGVLIRLPADHPRREAYREAFEALIDSAGRYQLPDGLWPWSMKQPRAPIDTSGSAMIGVAIERAIRAGVIGQERREMVDRIMAGLIRYTMANGEVTQAHDDTYSVGLYATEFGPAPWAQAATLSLGSLILDRDRGPSPPSP